jgi:hypothetical protein
VLDPETGEQKAVQLEPILVKLKQISKEFDWIGAFLFLASMTCLLTVVAEGLSYICVYLQLL